MLDDEMRFKLRPYAKGCLSALLLASQACSPTARSTTTDADLFPPGPEAGTGDDDRPRADAHDAGNPREGAHDATKPPDDARSVGVDASDDAAGPCSVTGTTLEAYRPVSDAVFGFIQAQSVHNAQFALSEGGSTVVSLAFTCPGAVGTTATSTTFRLASNSKAWTSAAIEVLFQQGRISRSTPAFSYLGLTTPLPSTATIDPRVLSITVGNLIDHESGWDDTVSPYFDPVHSMRQIALALDQSTAITQAQMVQYMLGQPLQEAPGTTYAYCNFCYVALGMIVAKASGESFIEFLNQEVAAPLGVTDLALSPTLEPRLPGEVGHYFSPLTGLSAIDVTSSALVAAPNGGDGLIREVAAPAGGLTTSAESMLKLMNTYLIWGVGPAPGAGEDWAREGGDEGTNTWAEQLADGKRWAFLINTRAYTTASAFTDFTSHVDDMLGTIP